MRTMPLRAISWSFQKTVEAPWGLFGVNLEQSLAGVTQHFCVVVLWAQWESKKHFLNWQNNGKRLSQPPKSTSEKEREFPTELSSCGNLTDTLCQNFAFQQDLQAHSRTRLKYTVTDVYYWHCPEDLDDSDKRGGAYPSLGCGHCARYSGRCVSHAS